MALVEQGLSGFRSKVNIASLQDRVEPRQPYRSRSEAAFTLAEVVIALAIAVLALSGVITGYILAANRAEWSAYSLAAQSLAMQRLEQTRAAKWDPRGNTTNGIVNDQLLSANFPVVSTNVLDIPISRTNFVYATNYTTITDIAGGSAPLRMIRVDCVWSYQKRGPFTNTIATYRAPDQ